MSFWGLVDSLSPLPIHDAVRRLNTFIGVFQDEVIVSPIRRRLSLARLNRFREDIESRIKHLVRMSRVKVNKGMTYRSISMTVAAALVSQPERAMFKKRLRAGERYSQLPSGMLLALGNVPVKEM